MKFTPKNFLKIILLITGILQTLIFLKNEVIAWEFQGLNYGVDTLKISTNLIAGETVEKEVRIYNLKNDPQTFEILINSFKILGENGQIKFEEIDKNTIQPAIVTDPTDITIPANSSEKVKIKFSVDERAALREYNYVIFVSPKAAQNQAGTSRSLVQGKIGILSFVNVLKDGKTLGEVSKRGGILDFNVAEINVKSPARFTAKISNTGNIHYDAISNLEIYNAKNDLIDSIKLKEITVLPGEVRNLESIDSGEIIWDYELIAGKYKAVLNVKSPDEVIQLKKEAFLYIIPLTQLILSLFIIIFLILFFILLRKKIAKKKELQ